MFQNDLRTLYWSTDTSFSTLPYLTNVDRFRQMSVYVQGINHEAAELPIILHLGLNVHPHLTYEPLGQDIVDADFS